MNYLLDKKLKRKKFSYIVFFVISLVILFYFRMNIFYGLSYVSTAIFRPVFILGNNIGGKLANISSFFISKNSLISENKNLKSQLSEDKAQLSNYNFILSENTKLKEILGRKIQKANMVLATILAKPNQSPYDTLIIDAGTKQGLQTGNMVFALGHSSTDEALGNIPIGPVAEIYADSSKIILFSNAGEKTQAMIGSVSIKIIGRGGGNFEMILPRDIVLQKGDPAVLPGITPYVLGIIEIIISDPRDSFQKALLVSPVNIRELKFVEVEI